MTQDIPSVTFNALPHADGSVEYGHAGYTILATVNGPIEPQRRDELPEEAFLEVHVREASGSGGPRIRLLETLLHRTLHTLLDKTAQPRTLIQVTLQILRTPADAYTAAPPRQHESVLPVLPHAVIAGVGALLNSNIAMRHVAVAVSVQGHGRGGGDVALEDGDSLRGGMGRAMHVFAFTGEGQMLLAESEGDFSFEEWDRAAEVAEMRCCGSGGKEGGLLKWLREIVADHITTRNKWRHGM